MRSILYTRIAPLKCISYNLNCPEKKCEIPYKEAVEAHRIFFYTTKTCVADEIGWDFVRCVKSMRTSFRGFCSEMSDRYNSNQSPGYPFMSGNTFVGYFFACVTVERAEVVLHRSFLWLLCQLVWWRGFQTAQGTVLNRA